jgi:hypothetical protein
MRDKNNRLNGILLENAGIAIMEKAMDPNEFKNLVNLAFEGLTFGLQVLAENGITSAVDARKKTFFQIESICKY